MARTDTIDSIWGSTGTAVDPGSTEINDGWAAEIPPFETQNFWQKRVDTLLKNIEDYGFMEWNSLTNYTIGSWALGSDGESYKSLTDNNLSNDPISSPVNWVSFDNITSLVSATEVIEGISFIASLAETQAGVNDSKFVTPYKIKNSIQQLVPDSSLSVKGKTAYASVAETIAGVLDTKAVTPSGVAGAFFPSGTKMLFQQTSAPVGWTKDTTHNNKALRVVSGSVTSGGTQPFTSVFSNLTTTGTSLTTSQMPSHSHSGSSNSAGSHYHLIANTSANDNNGVPNISSSNYLARRGGNTSNNTDYALSGTGTTPTLGRTSTTSSHSHTITVGSSGSGAAHTHSSDLRVQYVDIIVATKD